MIREKRYKQLYDKMNAEMNAYKHLLLKQPPETIINYAFEYSMREYILMCVVGGGLTETQVRALMNEQTPLKSIGRRAGKRIEDCILDCFRECINEIGDEWKTSITD